MGRRNVQMAQQLHKGGHFGGSGIQYVDDNVIIREKWDMPLEPQMPPDMCSNYDWEEFLLLRGRRVI